MVQEREPDKGSTVSKGVWTAQLFEHIEYFNSHNDLRELNIVLPFGIPRERRPKDYEKTEREKQGLATKNMMRRISSTPMGQFHYQPEAEIEPWKPRLKPAEATNDQVRCKPTLLVMRHDPADKKVMYLEQDLMAKPISSEIDKKSGFTYRTEENRSIVVRKYLAMINEEKMVTIVHEFIQECNRILYMYCDTR